MPLASNFYRQMGPGYVERAEPEEADRLQIEESSMRDFCAITHHGSKSVAIRHS